MPRNNEASITRRSEAEERAYYVGPTSPYEAWKEAQGVSTYRGMSIDLNNIDWEAVAFEFTTGKKRTEAAKLRAAVAAKVDYTLNRQGEPMARFPEPSPSGPSPSGPNPSPSASEG